MSARALQRVAVRMLYDARFLDEVYADVDRATADCELAEDERSWLVRPDRRAWRTDPLRRTRSLGALVEEFAVSVALFARACPDAPSRLDAFFSSRDFHRGMQRGESLAALFAGWFERQVAAPPAGCVRLEAAIARCRREAEASGSGPWPAPDPDPSGVLVLAPGVAVLELADGTVHGWAQVLAELRRGPVADRAIDPRVGVPALETGPGAEGVVVDARGADPRLELVSAELAGVLVGASGPVDFAGFCRHGAARGAGVADCRSIVESFAADGLLVAPAQTWPSRRPPW